MSCENQRQEFQSADDTLTASIVAESQARATDASAQSALEQATSAAEEASGNLVAAEAKVATDAVAADVAYSAYIDCVRGVGDSDGATQLPSRR